MLGTIDLSLHADVGKFYLWGLAVTTKSLCVSLSIMVPSKKLFIQNLQIRSPGREQSVYSAFSGVRIGILR